MRKPGRLLLCAGILAFLAVSCREPASSEVFIPVPGPYTFTLDFSDSLATYDVALFTRIDSRAGSVQALGELPLIAVWTAPDYSQEDVFSNPYYTFTEVVYLPLGASKRSYFSSQVWHPYRKGVNPGIYGDWTLTLSIPDTVQVRGLRGLGVELHRKYGK